MKKLAISLVFLLATLDAAASAIAQTTIATATGGGRALARCLMVVR